MTVPQTSSSRTHSVTTHTKSFGGKTPKYPYLSGDFVKKFIDCDIVQDWRPKAAEECGSMWEIQCQLQTLQDERSSLFRDEFEEGRKGKTGFQRADYWARWKKLYGSEVEWLDFMGGSIRYCGSKDVSLKTFLCLNYLLQLANCAAEFSAAEVTTVSDSDRNSNSEQGNEENFHLKDKPKSLESL